VVLFELSLEDRPPPGAVTMNMNMLPLAGRPERSSALISVVAPVFNEHGVLCRLHESVTAQLEAAGLLHELVLVDDGSRDGSAAVMDELAARDPRVRAVHLSRNFGHQAALQAGLCVAAGDAVVLMDADMQDDPAALPRFVQAWLEGADVVYAVRTARKEGPVKRALFRAFYRILQRVSTTPMPLDAGAFGLLDRRVVRELTALSERDRYLPGLRSWVGFRQMGIEVERGARYDDQPRVSLMGLWRLAKTAVFSFSSFPLTVFKTIGYLALAVFTLLAGYSLFCKLFTNLAVPGWASHVLSASFFGALNALGISMLGEYVIRIYDQVRGRPLFLIDRIESHPAPAADGDAPYHELLATLTDALADSPADSPADLLAESTDEPPVMPQRRRAKSGKACSARTSVKRRR
jgi:glycosyltransferase involved in cell wall biosynthesis